MLNLLTCAHVRRSFLNWFDYCHLRNFCIR
jgi:hypothetical protein